MRDLLERPEHSQLPLQVLRFRQHIVWLAGNAFSFFGRNRPSLCSDALWFQGLILENVEFARARGEQWTDL